MSSLIIAYENSDNCFFFLLSVIGFTWNKNSILLIVTLFGCLSFTVQNDVRAEFDTGSLRRVQTTSQVANHDLNMHCISFI